MNLKITLLFLISLLLGSSGLFGQSFKLSGIVMDKETKTPLIGAIVILKEKNDTTKQNAVLSDNNGRFVVNSVRNNSYILTIQNMSYQKLYRPIIISGKDLNLGIIDLEAESKVLNEVVVRGQGPTAVQKGDTTEMSSSAYKTNPDANAEDLVKKMPGITVENGTVKAQGEEVKKVYVDGKQFFGDDPSVALRNLPADVIDKVQIFNKLSEQSELTGVDDGQSSRTINIITKQNRRTGQFGKLTAGTDFGDKYLLAGSVNVFKGNRRVTFIGNLNNVNQQNFSTQDLIGTGGMGMGMGMGMGGRGGGRMGSFGGGQNGITQTQSLGLNFTDNWGKKITANGSYFYNATDNHLLQESNTENLFITDGKFSNNTSDTRTKNYNHNFNMRIEYNIDSANSLLIMPRFSAQTNESDKNSLYTISGGRVNTTENNMSATDGNGYNFGNNLIFRHKFAKPRRTLSLNLSTSYNERETENTQLAFVDSIADNQYSDNNTNGLTVSGNVQYTEPISKYGMLMLNANVSKTKNETDKKTFQIDDTREKINRLDSLSNIFDNDYDTYRGGISYNYKKGGFNLTTGVDYQQATLKGNQQFPQESKVNETFENFLPNLMLMYKMSSKSNLRVFYRSSTNAPSISQLQKVTDNSNRLNLSTGNPKLDQEYSHNLMSQYSFANADKGINAFFTLSGTYTQDNIGNRIYYAQHDSLFLPEFNVKLQPGGQLSVPVNLDYSYSLRTLANFGVYVKPIRSNINILGGVNYTQSPGYVDSIFNRSNSYSITNSVILASNISEKIDFSVSYTSNYSIAENTADIKTLSNTKYWYQSANLKVNWIFWKGFVLQSDIAGQFNKGLSGSYNENYMVWNASFGKKFLKNNAAELKLSVFDILNQNNNISRTVTSSMIQDTRTNTFPRYFMLVFTYNLRNFNGQKAPSQNSFPGGGGMMMPMGPPPGGGTPPAGMPMGPPPGM